MKKLFVFVSFSAICLIVSASSLKEKLIGVWKIQTMEIKGVKMIHQQLGSPFIEFNEEGGFMIKVGATSEKGKYTVKGNTVTLKFLIPRKPIQKITITKLDQRELNYTTTDTTGQVNVVCFKITEGLSGEKD